MFTRGVLRCWRRAAATPQNPCGLTLHCVSLFRRSAPYAAPCLHHRNRKHNACVFFVYKGSPALLTPRSGNAAEPLRANAPLRFAIPSLRSLRLPCLHHRNRKHNACVFFVYMGSPALLTPRSGNAAEPLRADAPPCYAIPSLHSLRLPCLHHRNRKHKACVFLFYKGSPALLTPRSGNAAEPLWNDNKQ